MLISQKMIVSICEATGSRQTSRKRRRNHVGCGIHRPGHGSRLDRRISAAHAGPCGTWCASPMESSTQKHKATGCWLGNAGAAYVQVIPFADFSANPPVAALFL